jgi:hypothetical protein
MAWLGRPRKATMQMVVWSNKFVVQLPYQIRLVFFHPCCCLPAQVMPSEYEHGGAAAAPGISHSEITSECDKIGVQRVYVAAVEEQNQDRFVCKSERVRFSQ